MDTFQEQMLSGDSLNPVLANNVSSIPTDIVRMWLKQLEYLSNAQDTVGFAMKIQDFHDILGEELKVSQEPL